LTLVVVVALGDTYTPSSGIWQTVWLESAPKQHVENLIINQASTTAVTVTAQVSGGDADVDFEVHDATGTSVASAKGKSGTAITITVPTAKLWSPDSPYLYDLKVSIIDSIAGGDTVLAYFGLRTFVLGKSRAGQTRPLLNGAFEFMAGFLDQSWWPDGQYTAPTDEALAYDIQVVPMFGLNMIRLHQKVNPERWYYHADKIGVVVFQDMPQKYGHASPALIPFFRQDLKAMIQGRGNHPSIVQFETFNEGDCVRVFNKKPNDVAAIVDLATALTQPYGGHLIDTNSGGPANNLKLGQVNDIHSYPYPGDPKPDDTRYSMVGEFGGIGAFIQGKEWKPKSCHTYKQVDTPAEEASTYVGMAKTLESKVDHISASVYTQTTDLELECDGFLNYDRSSKFSDEGTKSIHDANQAIIAAGRKAI